MDCSHAMNPIWRVIIWWFGTLFIFTHIGNNHPVWLIRFRGVETTNQTWSPTLPNWIWGFTAYFADVSEAQVKWLDSQKLRDSPAALLSDIIWYDMIWYDMICLKDHPWTDSIIVLYSYIYIYRVMYIYIYNIWIYIDQYLRDDVDMFMSWTECLVFLGRSQVPMS